MELLATRVVELLAAFARSEEPDLMPRSRKERNLGYRLLQAALSHGVAADAGIKLRTVQLAAAVLKAFRGVPMDESYTAYVRDTLAQLLLHGRADVRALVAQTFALLPAALDDEETLEAFAEALLDPVKDVLQEVLRTLQQVGGWGEALVEDVARHVHDADAGVRELAFGALATDQARPWLDRETLLRAALAGVRDPEPAVRAACVAMLLRRWRGADIEAELGALTGDRHQQDALMEALVSSDLRLPVKYFRAKIDGLTPVCARLWRKCLEATPADARELLLPNAATFAAALDYYSAQSDQFVTFCGMLPFFDASNIEAHRDKLSELLRKILLQLDASDSLFSVDIAEAAQEALKVLHPEAADWVQVCLEIVLDLVDEDVHGPDGVRWVPALHVAHGIVQDPRVNVASAAGIQELLRNVILRGLGSLDPAARALAVRALGCYCLSSLEEAKNYMLVFCTVLNKDLAEVQAEATKVILDFCLVFGASLAPSLTPQVLEELRHGPQCEREANPVLARVLAPLDVRDAPPALQEIAAVGLAKLLRHDRLHSYPMLGRAVAKAVESEGGVMERFAREYAQSVPKVSLPRLRMSLGTAVVRLRGRHQGEALRALAKNWNVAWDSLAADGLRRGGDVLALQSLSPKSNTSVAEVLRDAIFTRFVSERSPIVLQALRDWAVARSIVLPGSQTPGKKSSGRKATGAKKRAAAVAVKAEDEEGDDFLSPAPRKKAAPAAPVRMTPEMLSARKFQDQLDVFELQEEEASMDKRQPETALKKRPRAVIDLTDGERVAEENERLRALMEGSRPDSSPVKEEAEAVPAAVSASKRARDSEETPLRADLVHVMFGTLSEPELARLQDCVAQLGGHVVSGSSISLKVSHVVVGSLRNNTSPKVLAAALKGCWIVTPEWLLQSAEQHTFVGEGPFGARFERATRPVFQKHVFLAPDLSREELQRMEPLLFSRFLGGATRAPSAAAADIIVAGDKSAHRVKLGQKLYTWAELKEAIVTH